MCSFMLQPLKSVEVSYREDEDIHPLRVQKSFISSCFTGHRRARASTEEVSRPWLPPKKTCYLFYSALLWHPLVSVLHQSLTDLVLALTWQPDLLSSVKSWSTPTFRCRNRTQEFWRIMEKVNKRKVHSSSVLMFHTSENIGTWSCFCYRNTQQIPPCCFLSKNKAKMIKLCENYRHHYSLHSM